MSDQAKPPAQQPSADNTVTFTPFVPKVTGEIIEVQLGKSKIFQVHKDVLERSPYFKTALKPEWKEGRNGKPINLEEDHPKAFAAYVSWLYSHNVDSTMNTLKWARMYVLGEKLLDPEFQDVVLAMMMRECEAQQRWPIGTQINTIYEGTTENSPARRLLVDFYCWVGLKRWVVKDEDEEPAPAEFMKDLVIALMAMKELPKEMRLRKMRPWVKDPGQYLLRNKAENAEMTE